MLERPRLAILIAGLLILPTAVTAQSFIDSLLAKAAPCSGIELSESVFGLPVKIGLQEVESPRIDRLSLDIENDMARIEAAGALACETTPGSVLNGDARLAVEARARVDLSTCEVQRVRLTPLEFGGYLADVLEAGWEPLIAPYLRKETERLLAEACMDLLVGPVRTDAPAE